MEKFITRMVLRWCGIVMLLCDTLVFVPLIVLMGLAMVIGSIIRRRSLKDIWNDYGVKDFMQIVRACFMHSIHAILTGEDSKNMNKD